MFSGLGLEDEILYKKRRSQLTELPTVSNKRKNSTVSAVMNKKVNSGSNNDLTLGYGVANSTSMDVDLTPRFNVSEQLALLKNSGQMVASDVKAVAKVMQLPEMGGGTYPLALTGDIVSQYVSQMDIPVASQIASVVNAPFREWRERIESHMIPGMVEEIHSDLTPYLDYTGVSLNKRKSPEAITEDRIRKMDYAWQNNLIDPGPSKKRQQQQYLSIMDVD